ncbi:MAG: hypothetical protein KME23_20600 [Goleter apudmare HA4340-LM2]|jgi:hypothetical protein|nr:hypothetical protein [Goleter apudmare HA4340-LM2]
MQLLNSLQTQWSYIPEHLQTSLHDIINQLQIDSKPSIKHPSYKPLELPESTISHFQQLPPDLQNKLLSLQLRNFLYGIYYNGSLKRALSPSVEATNVALNQNLENNTFFGVDISFYDRLHESNQSEGYFNHDWQVVREETDGSLAVHKGGLTLHIESDRNSLQSSLASTSLRHLQPQQPSVRVGNLVAVKLPKNLVQNGFYMAVANAGAPENNQELVRIYFNFSPDGAVAVMNSLTAQLNAISVAFKFKTLYNPSDYERYDSAVLYFDKSNYEAIHPVLERVYLEHQSHFSEEVPLFTKWLAPGLACAEEPTHKFSEQESFGTNRCQIVANALLDAWQQNNDTPHGRMASILQHFSLEEIELQRPYLNANSEDIYTPLQGYSNPIGFVNLL